MGEKGEREMSEMGRETGEKNGREMGKMGGHTEAGETR